MAKKQIALRIPCEIYEVLQNESERIGISVHELIMLAIDYYRIHKISNTDG